jgi:transposase
MARRTFDVIDVTEIPVHWHAGRSLNELSQSLGVDRKTIRKYVVPAVAAGIVPGDPAKGEGEWQDLVREWFPELADTRLRQVTWPAIGEHHDYIVAQLKAGVRMSTIHQRLRDEHGLAASVASFRRYVAACVPEEARRSQVTVWNPRPAEAGEQAQIDYGQLGRWVDPVTGKLRTVWAFVMVLACSRHMFVRPVLKMDQRAWTECHVEAFAFFGGVPARLVSDNLKTGVDKPDLYDPKINRSYAELAEHYGCLIDPARAVKPRDKPQVERPMPYVRDSFWRGREFASLEQMQAGAARWSAEVTGRRPCRPLDGAAPPRSSARSRRRSCGRCRRSPFVLASWARAKIGPDIHAQVEKVLYSVPWRHIGKTADVRVTATMVQFFGVLRLDPQRPPARVDVLGAEQAQFFPPQRRVVCQGEHYPIADRLVRRRPQDGSPLPLVGDPRQLNESRHEAALVAAKLPAGRVRTAWSAWCRTRRRPGCCYRPISPTAGRSAGRGDRCSCRSRAATTGSR